jgi:hypothetical protein
MITWGDTLGVAQDTRTQEWFVQPTVLADIKIHSCPDYHLAHTILTWSDGTIAHLVMYKDTEEWIAEDIDVQLSQEQSWIMRDLVQATVGEVLNESLERN